MNSSSVLNSSYGKIAFLALLIFSLLMPFSANAFADNSSGSVNVTANIPKTRVVKIGGEAGKTRSAAFTPIDMADFEITDSGRMEIRGTFSVSLGSNVDWQINARVENLDNTRDRAKSAGWELEIFRLTWSGGKAELGDSARKLMSGGNGKHQFELAYEAVLVRAEENGAPPSLKGLENVLVLSFA